MRHSGGRTGRRACRSGVAASALSAIVMLAGVMPVPAQGWDRWTVEGDNASVRLATPNPAEQVIGARLVCEAQRWMLHLETVPDVNVSAGGAVLAVGNASARLSVLRDGDGLAAALPRSMLEPLMAGLRAVLTFEGAAAVLGAIDFPLRGSRLAVSAAQDVCSPRDMSSYRTVTLTPYSSYLNLARTLREDDIAAFATSTASQPKLDVAMIEGERRLFFTRLCGSSWYYGATGCNITGFAPDDSDAGWREVYDTENVFLYTDPKSATEGWPDIVTLPVRGDDAGRIWQWTGASYAFDRELPDEPEAKALGLRGASD